MNNLMHYNIYGIWIQGPDGVKRFLLGRQLIVVPLGFVVAQITNFGRFPVNNFPTALYFLTINLGFPGKILSSSSVYLIFNDIHHV